jgi:hypothetical protein
MNSDSKQASELPDSLKSQPNSDFKSALGGELQERREVAIRAAALIADSGLGFHEAKQRAAAEIFGRSIPKAVIPNQFELEAALLEHLNLFDEEGHRERCLQLRNACASLMQLLAEFSPFVTGAAWKGIVAEHAHGHLQVFNDDSKELCFLLLNKGLQFDSVEVPHFNRRNSFIEALALQWQDWPFQISLYDSDDLRGALIANEQGEAERGNLAQLKQRLEQVT